MTLRHAMIDTLRETDNRQDTNVEARNRQSAIKTPRRTEAMEKEEEANVKKTRAANSIRGNSGPMGMASMAR